MCIRVVNVSCVSYSWSYFSCEYQENFSTAKFATTVVYLKEMRFQSSKIHGTVVDLGLLEGGI